MDQLDRRKFIARSGIGAAAAGGLWLAPQIVTSNAAFAGASCLREETIAWSGSGAWSGVTYPISGSYPELTVTASTTQVGTLTPLTGNGQIDNQAREGMPTGSRFFLGMDDAAYGAGFDTTFTFTGDDAWNVRFAIYDIDLANVTLNRFTDKVWVTTTPSSTPATTSNGTSPTGTGTATSPFVGSGNVTTWTGAADNFSANSGWGGYTLAGPVSSFTIHYRADRVPNFLQRNYNQYIGVGSIIFCR